MPLTVLVTVRQEGSWRVSCRRDDASHGWLMEVLELVVLTLEGA